MGDNACPPNPRRIRATVTALLSLDGSKGLSFHILSLVKDHCVPLVIKNLGRQMPEDVFQEELASLVICVLGILQLRSGGCDQDAYKGRPLTTHLIWLVAQ